MSLTMMGLHIVGRLAAPVFLQVTVVALLALALARAFGAGRPAFRYAVSLGALACALLAPLLAGLGGRAGGLAVPLPFVVAPAVPSPVASPAPALAGDAMQSTPAPAVSPTPPAPGRATIPVTRLDGALGLLILAWVIGGLWHALRLARGHRQIRRLLQGAVPFAGPGADDLRAQVQSDLGRPLPPILVSPRAPVPLVAGTGRPRVLLPQGLAGRLTPRQLRAVLVHECAHVALAHPRGLLIQRAAALLLWPHPLVHALCRELSRAREEVCDNFVLGLGDAPGYARALLLVATGGVTATPAPLGLLPARWRLEDRVAGLLDPRRNRATRISPRLAAVLGTVLVGLGAAAAQVRFVPASPDVPRMPVIAAAAPPMVRASPGRLIHPPAPLRTARRAAAPAPARIAVIRRRPARQIVAFRPVAPFRQWVRGAPRPRLGRPASVRRQLATRPAPKPPTPATAPSRPSAIARMAARLPSPGPVSAAGVTAHATPVATTEAASPPDLTPLAALPGVASVPSQTRSPFRLAGATSRPAAFFQRRGAWIPPQATTPRLAVVDRVFVPGSSTPTVWVNTRTGNYHYPGDRWYGTTQQGQYMTETQAVENGYHRLGSWPVRGQ